MPVNMTFDSLVQDLTNYLQRYDEKILAQIPSFIALAQQRIPRELKLLGFRQEVTGAFDGTAESTGIMAKPADWRKTISFYVGTGEDDNVHSPVWERDYDYIRRVFPNPAVTGTPRFYGDADYNHWLVQPSPVAGTLYKIPYYSTLTFLDETVQTNWLTVNAPDLLLYASLLEAIPFVKVDERIQVWQGFYSQSKNALIMQDLEGRYDKSAIVTEPQSAPTGPQG